MTDCLFDCLTFRYPAYTPILHTAIELWYHDPQVTTPVLKLMAELVQNRSQRLQFDVSSPNGILLFRETSRMIVNYGTRILTLGDVPKDQIYPLKYPFDRNNIHIFYVCLCVCLNVSVCHSFLTSMLYCDDYAERHIDMFFNAQVRALRRLRQLRGLPLIRRHSARRRAQHFHQPIVVDTSDGSFGDYQPIIANALTLDLLEQNYPKLSQTYYVLLECLAQDHMNFLANLEPNVFLYILSSISEGLNALDTMVCTGCCATLDHIVTYLFKWLSKTTKKSGPTAGSETCLKVLEIQPEILQQMLSTILNIIMFEDCRNQWSMSRPLLGLILLNEDYFNQLRQSIVSQQPSDKQSSMAQWFDNLMEGIERNLLTKNRDRFVLSPTRRALPHRSFSLSLPLPSGSHKTYRSFAETSMTRSKGPLWPMPATL